VIGLPEVIQRLASHVEQAQLTEYSWILGEIGESRTIRKEEFDCRRVGGSVAGITSRLSSHQGQTQWSEYWWIFSGVDGGGGRELVLPVFGP
jgi:hypothetical protein